MLSSFLAISLSYSVYLTFGDMLAWEGDPEKQCVSAGARDQDVTRRQFWSGLCRLWDFLICRFPFYLCAVAESRVAAAGDQDAIHGKGSGQTHRERSELKRFREKKIVTV